MNYRSVCTRITRAQLQQMEKDYHCQDKVCMEGNKKFEVQCFHL